MGSFERALSIVLEHEGGDKFTDDPLDGGGATRFGISQVAHPTVDVRNLTREGAAEIYRAEYWQPMQCDELPPPLALPPLPPARGSTSVTGSPSIRKAPVDAPAPPPNGNSRRDPKRSSSTTAQPCAVFSVPTTAPQKPSPAVSTTSP